MAPVTFAPAGAMTSSAEFLFSNIECLRVCFVPAVKSSAVVLTILCFFVFTKREQVITYCLFISLLLCYF